MSKIGPIKTEMTPLGMVGRGKRRVWGEKGRYGRGRTIVILLKWKLLSNSLQILSKHCQFPPEIDRLYLVWNVIRRPKVFKIRSHLKNDKKSLSNVDKSLFMPNFSIIFFLQNFLSWCICFTVYTASPCAVS